MLTLPETGWGGCSDRQASGTQAIGDLARAAGLELATQQRLDVHCPRAGELGDRADVIAVPSQTGLELVELRPASRDEGSAGV